MLWGGVSSRGGPEVRRAPVQRKEQGVVSPRVSTSLARASGGPGTRETAGWAMTNRRVVHGCHSCVALCWTGARVPCHCKGACRPMLVALLQCPGPWDLLVDGAPRAASTNPGTHHAPTQGRHARAYAAPITSGYQAKSKSSCFCSPDMLRSTSSTSFSPWHCGNRQVQRLARDQPRPLTRSRKRARSC